MEKHHSRPPDDNPSSKKRKNSKFTTSKRQRTVEEPDPVTLPEHTQRPFWSPQVHAASTHLWLPTNGDKVDYNLSKLEDYESGRPIYTSWHTTRVVAENKKSQTSQHPHVTLNEIEEDEDDKMLSRVIKVQPTKKQNQILRQWMGTCRWTYNQCVEHYGSFDPDVKKMQMREHLRHLVKTKDASLVQDKPWVFETPEAIRDATLNHFIDAYWTQHQKVKEQLKENNERQRNGLSPKEVTYFKMKKRHRKNGDMIEIVQREFVKDKLFPRLEHMNKKTQELEKVNFGHFRGTEKWLEFPIDGGVKVTRKRTNEFFIHIPITYVPEKRHEIAKTIALDPGNRKFLTGYDSERVLTFCNHEFYYIERYLKAIDQLQSKHDRCTNRKKRRRYRQAMDRLRKRVKNLREDCHKKICKYLVDAYDLILLPKFESKKMVSALHSKAARNMMTWSHYSFQQRLKFKAQQKGKTVIIVNESYTSKTCTRCGRLSSTNGNEIYQCQSQACRLRMDRDCMASRNIYLKYMYNFIPPRGPTAVGVGSSEQSLESSFQEILQFLH